MKSNKRHTSVPSLPILAADGTTAASYTYDAWGNCTATGIATIATLNPLRYRSYVYDTETKLYYLQSRYYDPEVGRFINADCVISGSGGAVQGYNVFAYCFNNPSNLTDSTGTWPTWEDIKEKLEEAAEWVDDNIVQPIVEVVEDIIEDCKNFNSANQSEEEVLASNYFSSYKGVPVLRTNGTRSGSFGVIFLTRETNNRENPEDVVRHEYGHVKQLAELGVLKYTVCIMLPSWRQWGTGEYYCKPFEITADVYGGVKSRTHSKNEISRGFLYLDAGKMFGPIAWILID